MTNMRCAPSVVSSAMRRHKARYYKEKDRTITNAKTITKRNTKAITKTNTKTNTNQSIRKTKARPRQSIPMNFSSRQQRLKKNGGDAS